MANIASSINKLRVLEFSNDVTKLLEKNKGEIGLTYFGIYQTANPTWTGWNIIHRYLQVEPDMKKCSVLLSNVSDLNESVAKFYKTNYWDRANLDKVESQLIADEIFLFGVNSGMSNGIKKAQEIVGVLADGLVGQKTIEALNNYDEEKFSKEYDYKEKKYYDDVIASNPSKAINKKGWYARADFV